MISLPFFFFSLRLLGSQGDGSLSLGATSSDDGRRTGEPSRVGTDLPAPPGCAGPQRPLRLRLTWSAWRDLRPESPPLCAVTMNESANRVTSRRASKALRQAEDAGRHVPPHGSAHAKCPDARCVATGGRFLASSGGGRREWGSFLGGDENILELVLTAAQFYECTDNTELSAWKGFDMLPFSQRRGGESTFHRLLSLPASLPSPPTFPGTLTRTAPI